MSTFLPGIDIGMMDDTNSLKWIFLNESMCKNPGRIQIVVVLLFAHSCLQFYVSSVCGTMLVSL